MSGPVGVRVVPAREGYEPEGQPPFFVVLEHERGVDTWPITVDEAVELATELLRVANALRAGVAP